MIHQSCRTAIRKADCEKEAPAQDPDTTLIWHDSPQYLTKPQHLARRSQHGQYGEMVHSQASECTLRLSRLGLGQPKDLSTEVWPHSRIFSLPLPSSKQKVRACQAQGIDALEPDRGLICAEVQIELGAKADVDHQVVALRDPQIGNKVLDARKASQA